MKIPWIESWNEHRRRKAEARKESREVERMAKAYDGLEKSFSQAFGLPFELAVRAAIAPHMAVMVREALPDNLAALAEDNPAINGSGSDPGTLVASLSRGTGAYWGPAPEVGAVSTAAFHATMEYDSEHDKYTISWRGGTAQRFGESPVVISQGSQSNVSANLFGYLLYSPANSPNWTMATSGSGFPNAGTGQIVVALWHFTYAQDGGGSLTQNFEGGVLIPRFRNAVDA